MSIEQALERSHNIIRSALYSGISPEWQNDARDVLIRDKKYLTSSSSRRDKTWVCPRCSQGGNTGKFCDWCQNPAA